MGAPPALLAAGLTLCNPFVQRSLPLLETQIRERYQQATEELCQYGEDIPKLEVDKILFLIKVRMTLGCSGTLGHQVLLPWPQDPGGPPGACVCAA